MWHQGDPEAVTKKPPVSTKQNYKQRINRKDMLPDLQFIYSVDFAWFTMPIYNVDFHVWLCALDLGNYKPEMRKIWCNLKSNLKKREKLLMRFSVNLLNLKTKVNT